MYLVSTFLVYTSTNYMYKKDFDINDFLQDTENSKNISKDL